MSWGASPGEHALEPGQPFDLVLEPGPEAVVLQTTTGVVIDCEGGTYSGLEGVYRGELRATVTNGVGVIGGGTPCATSLGGSTATVKFDANPTEPEVTFFLAGGGRPKARLSLAEHNTMNLAFSTSGGEHCEYAISKMKGPRGSRKKWRRTLVRHSRRLKRRKMKLVAGNTGFCGKGIYFSATFAYASLSNEGFGVGYRIFAD